MLQTVALFVKPPIPGRVKTRLARAIGADEACTIYRTLADHTIQQVQASGTPLALFFDGSDPAALPPAWVQASQVYLPQQGDDLGERMAAVFRYLFAAGVKQAVLIGSDIPGIDAAYLQQAFELLAANAMVLGPALDGGYCLIGFNKIHFTESVFQNIPWSTDQVFELTLHSVQQAALTVGLLPPLQDIDTIADLKHLNPARFQVD